MKQMVRSLNNLIQFFMQYITTIRSSRSQMVFEIDIFKVLQHSKENTCVEVSFKSKLQALRPATLLEKDSNTEVFL